MFVAQYVWKHWCRSNAQKYSERFGGKAKRLQQMARNRGCMEESGCEWRGVSRSWNLSDVL